VHKTEAADHGKAGDHGHRDLLSHNTYRSTRRLLVKIICPRKVMTKLISIPAKFAVKTSAYHFSFGIVAWKQCRESSPSPLCGLMDDDFFTGEHLPPCRLDTM
jgi:hypothetical protein